MVNQVLFIFKKILFIFLDAEYFFQTVRFPLLITKFIFFLFISPQTLQQICFPLYIFLSRCDFILEGIFVFNVLFPK